MMKLSRFIVGLCLISLPAFGSEIEERLEGTYNLYLYFGDSEPFLDELKLTINESGELQGRMHVPNDFDAALEDIELKSGAMRRSTLTFAVPLPEKYHNSFGDKLFYELRFRSLFPYTLGFEEQFVGFVTHRKTGPTYVGSVVGFRKKN